MKTLLVLLTIAVIVGLTFNNPKSTSREAIQYVQDYQADYQTKIRGGN